MFGPVFIICFESWKWSLRVTPIFGMFMIVFLIFIVEEPEKQNIKSKDATESLKSSFLEELKYLINALVFFNT